MIWIFKIFFTQAINEKVVHLVYNFMLFKKIKKNVEWISKALIQMDHMLVRFFELQLRKFISKCF